MTSSRPSPWRASTCFHVLGFCAQGRYGELADYLLAALGSLSAAGADFAALSANTPHIVFDRLCEGCDLPLVSIVKCVRDEALLRGYHRVGLLGTAFTTGKTFFKEPFERVGIGVVTPAPADAALVAQRISGELELGIRHEPDENRQLIQEREALDDIA